MDIEHVMFTGGEPTLHPDFGKLLATVATLDLKTASSPTAGISNEFGRACSSIGTLSLTSHSVLMGQRGRRTIVGAARDRLSAWSAVFLAVGPNSFLSV